MNITTNTTTFLADTITPVGLHLNLRDKFYNSFLLESSDYHSNENALSFICLAPLATFKVESNSIQISGLGLDKNATIIQGSDVTLGLQQFINQFPVKEKTINGIFGYTAYDAIQYFEKINIKKNKKENAIPIINYSFYKYIIQINHFKNELTIIENLVDDEISEIDKIEKLVKTTSHPQYNFKLEGEQHSNLTDDDFKEMVKKGKFHCQRGDVFQIVLSRQFLQKFKGDEFNVYRALRSVNPSPYLFYFDFGDYKLFGSSPEAQIKVENGKATINPIAGTFKRTGNDIEDRELAEKLAADPKETAEHNMLVDLARNDLSKHGKNVRVKTYKEVQFYSHVIHLVSEVTADINQKESVQLFADTFPAGTLSGAPKYKALKLIEEYENTNRGFYGGAIGYFGFDGSVNHAITIRSFLSKKNTLYSQAGAGVVIKSNEESEMQEVKNKLGALQQALKLAEQL
ncbi:anthranilate synthase component I family protein [Vicingus serpentipes]|uniref:Anthranilate synthase component 1 n=1 Tax=Vicingus serpentipes TaxID=1926625 RepID=A0A5C6RPM9_9FLAO|nr:anthranilate synthase component I family protein [Vicingus serpentipes]TXB64298.1 anthranilate synthase component I family protein [Vicingus serpentipes]